MTEPIPPKAGLRIGVFHSLNDTTLALLGYGVYEGDEVPPNDILSTEGPPGLVGMPVPKLRLDDGTLVWGCEAWWNTETEVKAFEQGRTIVKPKIESLRKHAQAAWQKANDDLDKNEEALP